MNNIVFMSSSGEIKTQVNIKIQSNVTLERELFRALN